MNRRGFTLIELLAVILILGIIALIAIPTVNNIITESKVGAWKSTANNVANSYEQYAQLCEMKSDCTKVASFTTSGTEGTDKNTGSTVKKVVGLKGDLPATFTTLMLNSNGDALVAFTEDGITCTNFSGEASLTTTTIDMACSK